MIHNHKSGANILQKTRKTKKVFVILKEKRNMGDFIASGLQKKFYLCAGIIR